MHVTAILGPLHFALRQLNTVVCSFHHRLAQGMLFFFATKLHTAVHR